MNALTVTIIALIAEKPAVEIDDNGVLVLQAPSGLNFKIGAEDKVTNFGELLGLSAVCCQLPFARGFLYSLRLHFKRIDIMALFYRALARGQLPCLVEGEVFFEGNDV